MTYLYMESDGSEVYATKEEENAIGRLAKYVTEPSPSVGRSQSNLRRQ